MTEKTDKMSFFEIAKNINSHGERLNTDADDVDYNSFMMNKLYSNTPDSVLFANELNMNWSIPKQQQYDFYRFGLSKNLRRFGKWEKRSTDDADLLKLVKEAFKYNRNKALEVIPILRDQTEAITAHLEKGGKK